MVLVTGAGGSIGAELSRQIARVGPSRLVLVENAENSLFEIRRELEEERHFARATAVLADCKDATRMREVFDEQSPSVVFHAAAYKHVTLMEENPVEAVRNNAVATRIVAAAAGEAGVERFVLVSTDKAVSPATVMGASKALAEWAVEAAQNRYKGTRYAAVRFGNVLGSSGSVVPIFRRQIAQGGPVTVTDDKMSRYFMTIPEAVQLIIRSGELAVGGEVFVLEMGDPVKIVELARNMIRLAGLEPDVDIGIEVVGRRPGEKIHEELFNPGERPQPTHAEKIVSAVQPPLEPEWVESAFARIEELVYGGDAAGLAGAVAELSAERALAVSGGPVRLRAARAAIPLRRPLRFSLLHGDHRADRLLCRARCDRRPRGSVRPLLLAGARCEAAARMGRTSARARGAARHRGPPAGRGAASAQAGGAARAHRCPRRPGRPVRSKPPQAPPQTPGPPQVPASLPLRRVARHGRSAARHGRGRRSHGGAPRRARERPRPRARASRAPLTEARREPGGRRRRGRRRPRRPARLSSPARPRPPPETAPPAPAVQQGLPPRPRDTQAPATDKPARPSHRLPGRAAHGAARHARGTGAPDAADPAALLPPRSSRAARPAAHRDHPAGSARRPPRAGGLTPLQDRRAGRGRRARARRRRGVRRLAAHRETTRAREPATPVAAARRTRDDGRRRAGQRRPGGQPGGRDGGRPERHARARPGGGDRRRGRAARASTSARSANADNQEQQRAESVVLYASGHRREAVVVSRRLKIPQREAIDPETQALAGDAGVVVVAGADQTP